MRISRLLLPHAFIPWRHGFCFSVKPKLMAVACRSSSSALLRSRHESKLTDWVVENLEDGDGGSITKSSETKAGENDTLPLSGLCIAEFRILAANSPYVDDKDQHHPIRLLVGRNGWGTGIHPTTRLCLEWLSKTLKGGEVLLDYGCGSGILSIAAIHTGASRAIGVDVEAEALVTAERNVELNFGSTDKFQALHVRQILPNDLGRPHGVDLCVANILVGQLVRPSMVSAIVTNVAPGGLLCLSGIRPQEVESLKTAYNAYIQEWVEDDYAELSATETEASVDSYGFDVGTWSRLVGRLNDRGNIDVEAMSELAVS